MNHPDRLLETLTVVLHSVSTGNPGTSIATLTGTTDYWCDNERLCLYLQQRVSVELTDTSYFIVFTPGTNIYHNLLGSKHVGNRNQHARERRLEHRRRCQVPQRPKGQWMSEGAVKLMKVSWATPPALTASSVEATTATLGIANYSGNWYYKHTSPSAGQCSSAVSGATASLSGLDSGTSYTFKAYSDSGCTSANELDSTNLLTKPGKVSGVSATAGNTSLAVSWTA